MSMGILKTDRLTLAPLRDEDEAALIALLTDPRITDTFMVPELPDAAAKAGAFRKVKDASVSGAHYFRGIRLRDRLIGFLNEVETDGAAIEIGYVVSPAEQGRGYAAEAFRAAIGELFAMGYETVVAGAFEGNEGSFRVMRSCGLTPIAREETIEWGGRSRRCFYCAISRPAQA